MTLTGSYQRKKRSPINLRYIWAQECFRKRLTNYDMQRQQTAAAKGACFLIKILCFHLLADLHTTQDEQTKVNGSYAPTSVFWGVISGLSAFPPRAPPSIPSTAVGDPCALWPFTRSEIWGFFLFQHSLYAPGMREVLLFCCFIWVQRASLGQERLMARLLCLCFWTAVTSRQHAQRVTDVYISFLPSACLVSWSPKVDRE